MSLRELAADLSPEERRMEVASILAIGVLRLKSRMHLVQSEQQNPSGILANRLDLSAECRPDGGSSGGG